MDNINLVESFSELKDIKNIDKESMISIMKDVFRTIIVKKYGTSENFDIIVNPNKGDLEIWRNRVIVDDNYEDFNENLHITLSNALKVEPDFEIGEEMADELKITDFGRRSISSIRQILKTKIIDLGKENLFNKFKDRVGDIIYGDVQQILRNEVIVTDDNGTEFVLPKKEQIPGDFFKKGETIRAIISKVETVNGKVNIILSRTSGAFLSKVFEMEIPEVMDGLVTVKGVAREPGYKAKVAVESYDDRIDPVGTCVGARGSRIQPVVREINKENIDIINYTTNKSLYIIRALNQSKGNVDINEERKTANVIVEPDQLAMAIGKGGINIKLASKLTGYKISVFTDVVQAEDVLLDDFKDEIDGWIIDVLKSIGCETAKDVLNISYRELVKRTDLEEETITEIVQILESEFK